MTTLLLKTEPADYSFDDLVHDKTTVWDGVTNNAALANLRRARKGHGAFIYHTGDERAIVGLARIAGDPYEDPARPGLNKAGEPKFAVVGIRAVKKAKSPLSLGAMKGDERFAGFTLLRQPRLSVMPVPPEIDALIRELTGL